MLLLLVLLQIAGLTRAAGQTASLAPGPADAAEGGPAASGSAAPESLGTVIGTVRDTNGNVIPGAIVTLTRGETNAVQTATANANGFFTISVGPGRYAAAVAAPDLTTWTSGDVEVEAGDFREIAGIVLRVKAATAVVRVTPSQEQIAEEQIRDQEHQRIGGMFPNFFVSYLPNAAPLTARQKFELAWKSSIDPFSFVADGLTAGVEQAQNEEASYGQGMRGYAKRFGAQYAGDATSNFIGGAILPTIFRQDPRYFYRGTGNVFVRALYAVSTIAICKGDNGRWQPNYSSVLGTFASGAISNLYAPAADRGWGATLKNGAISHLMGTTGALLQEFAMRHFSSGVPGKGP